MVIFYSKKPIVTSIKGYCTVRRPPPDKDFPIKPTGFFPIGEKTYSQMEMMNRRVGLPLFQMEEGIVTNPFLSNSALSFQG